MHLKRTIKVSPWIFRRPTPDPNYSSGIDTELKVFVNSFNFNSYIYVYVDRYLALSMIVFVAFNVERQSLLILSDTWKNVAYIYCCLQIARSPVSERPATNDEARLNCCKNK